MRALHIATRLAGTDGVSLEAWKVARVLRDDFGFEPAYCAGELAPPAAEPDGNPAVPGTPPDDDTVADPPHTCIPEMHFRDPVSAELGRRAFAGCEPDPDLEEAVEARAQQLAARLRTVVGRTRPHLLVVQNAWAVPMQLPLARALAIVQAERGLPCLSHEHDYPWERERFATSRVDGFLERYFPFDGPRVRHLCINRDARDALARRRGVEASVLPNVMDFRHSPPAVDAYAGDVRDAIGLGPERRLFLQPTRVVPRKGIELAIDLLAARDDPRDALVIAHEAGDEGHDYLAFLRGRARERGVDLRHVADRVGDARQVREGRKTYALWDVYPHADFVTYPSLYEGFGNALLETAYFRKPALVNRYPVYARDIGPKGFSFVEIDGAADADAVRGVAALLEDGAARRRATVRNARVARRHFSLRVLRDRLAPELRALGFAA